MYPRYLVIPTELLKVTHWISIWIQQYSQRIFTGFPPNFHLNFPRILKKSHGIPIGFIRFPQYFLSLPQSSQRILNKHDSYGIHTWFLKFFREILSRILITFHRNFTEFPKFSPDPLRICIEHSLFPKISNVFSNYLLTISAQYFNITFTVLLLTGIQRFPFDHSRWNVKIFTGVPGSTLEYQNPH